MGIDGTFEEFNQIPPTETHEAVEQAATPLQELHKAFGEVSRRIDQKIAQRSGPIPAPAGSSIL